MKNTKLFTRGIGIMLGVALTGVLAGCVGYVDGPNRGAAYASVQDDYVYYPGYQVYYGSHTHQYYYPRGRSWVSRPAPPPHVSAEVLVTAPSVRLDFRDHPSVHHVTVVRQYPRNWAPPGPGRVRQ